MRTAHYDPEYDRIDREVQQEQDARQKRTPRLLTLLDRIYDAHAEKRWDYQTSLEFEALEKSVDERIAYGRDCTEDGKLELLKRLAKIQAAGVVR